MDHDPEHEQPRRSLPEIAGSKVQLATALHRLAMYCDYLSDPGHDFDVHLGGRARQRESLKRWSELALLMGLLRRTMHIAEVQTYVSRFEGTLLTVAGRALRNVGLEDYLPAAQVLLGLARTKEARVLLCDPAFQQIRRDPAAELCYRYLLARTRGLDSIWYSDLAGSLISNTAVAPGAMRRGDVYAFTHEIFYLTDFGRSVMLADVNLDVVESVLSHHIQAASALDDDDLLIELLFAESMVNVTQRDRTALLRGLEIRFQCAWFQRPKHSVLLANALDADLRERYEIGAQYHPLVVWIMVLASR